MMNVGFGPIAIFGWGVLILIVTRFRSIGLVETGLWLFVSCAIALGAKTLTCRR